MAVSHPLEQSSARAAPGMNHTPAPDFFAGGGEMGRRMRAYDWSSHPLGAPADWPQSLKTLVRVMLDSRYAMWMLWGPDITFFCNDAYLPTVGLKREWVLGSRADKVWEEIWPDIGPRIRQVLERGESTWDEALLLFLERSGFSEETYHTFSYSPVYDDDGRIAGMLCVVTEVTESVLAERRLHALRELGARASFMERTSTAQEACRVAVETLAQDPADVPFAAALLVDSKEGCVRPVAAAGVDLASLGLAQPQTIAAAAGRWPLAAVLDSRQGKLIEQLAQLQISAGRWPQTIERAFFTPVTAPGHDGVAALLVLGLSPRLKFDDRYRSFLEQAAVFLGQAITNARAFEEERRRAEALAEIDRAKTAFFSNVSHEFRTPLTLLLGPIEELLRQPRLAPAERSRLQLAHRNSLRLLKLVNSLLDFSRLEAGKVRARYEPVNLAATTTDLASTFRSAMERAGLEFEVDCPKLPQPVYLDREMWEKVVLNLLSNAFKFTLQGKVTVRLRSEGDSALLQVEDTGVGIPPHELPRLFERFHRVEGTQGRTHEGSGIGLALVQELVRLHQGSIEVSSHLQQGSTFSVRLHYGTAHLPRERLPETRATPSTAIGSEAFVQEALRWLPHRVDPVQQSPQVTDGELAVHQLRFASTIGARIVLADDNADMRNYLCELLEPYYAVEAVPDGQTALAAVRRERASLLLTDVMMPNLDGFGLLREVRADPTLRGLAVVLLSARAGEEARVEGVDAGADDYLVKPFSARELLTRVGALLERNRSRALIAYRNAQYETLFDQAPLGIFVVDADMRLSEVNPTARRVFGGLPDLVGQDFSQLMRTLWPEGYAQEILRLFGRTLESGESYFTAERAENRLDRPATEYYEWQINRIRLADGRYGVVCYFRDISTHVATRKGLQQQQRELEAADRQKNEFLAMLAHELRNPLAPIRNSSQVLARTVADDAQGARAVASIERQVTHLARLVDDLLDVSRITRGRIELRRQPVLLQEIVERAIETIDPLLRQKNHKLLLEGNARLLVDADPERLVQCVANVLSNAAKYSDAEGEIRIESRGEGGFAVLTVSDRGVGISQELLPRIFELFVQGDRGLDRAHGGLGIGLSIVKRVLEMHGGDITASSRGPRQGSTFVLRLPLCSRAPLEVPAAPPQKVQPRRILIVDDNEDAADSLGMVLGLDGHEVVAAYNGEQALERAQAFRPDVVLLDIGLPGVDGYEVARRIRACEPLQSVRLVAITGYGQEADRERARSAGFAYHLVKPLEFSALQRILVSAEAAAPPTAAGPVSEAKA
jgi:PAS domain S-box-containing protein